MEKQQLLTNKVLFKITVAGPDSTCSSMAWLPQVAQDLRHLSVAQDLRLLSVAQDLRLLSVAQDLRLLSVAQDLRLLSVFQLLNVFKWQFPNACCVCSLCHELRKHRRSVGCCCDARQVQCRALAAVPSTAECGCRLGSIICRRIHKRPYQKEGHSNCLHC
ncbi:hypothetical protein DV515_00008238 [Chloebia gouldiae]|uniref:Uncharacterized protein n=1 Tax=Chloebia gouldiae TaxID=44316 RepID=A0A3L8SGN7_CHLGU|nr:hypothetical protein DV515_00008238 [Chloebia gouldiae]